MENVPMSHDPSENIIAEERRKFERAYFSSREAVTAIASCVPLPPIPNDSGVKSRPGSDLDHAANNFIGTITELSIGGLYFILRKHDATNLQVGTILILKEIKATILNCMALNIQMEIISIHNYEFVDHIGLGCYFTDITDKDSSIIRQLVKWGREGNVAPNQ